MCSPFDFSEFYFEFLKVGRRTQRNHQFALASKHMTSIRSPPPLSLLSPLLSPPQLTKDDLRVLMHEEIVSHYREETEEYRSDNATPLEHFNRTMLSNLPNGAPAPPNANAKTVPRKTRRKSF